MKITGRITHNWRNRYLQPNSSLVKPCQDHRFYHCTRMIVDIFKWCKLTPATKCTFVYALPLQTAGAYPPIGAVQACSCLCEIGCAKGLVTYWLFPELVGRLMGSLKTDVFNIQPTQGEKHLNATIKSQSDISETKTTWAAHQKYQSCIRNVQ